MCFTRSIGRNLKQTQRLACLLKSVEIVKINKTREFSLATQLCHRCSIEPSMFNVVAYFLADTVNLFTVHGPRTSQPKRHSFSVRWILAWAVTSLQQGGQHVQDHLVVIFLIHGFKHFVYIYIYIQINIIYIYIYTMWV